MKNLAIIILVSFIALSCKEETINSPGANKNPVPVEPGNLVTDTYVESVPDSAPRVGDNAPNFILNRNTEHEFELKDLRGKVVYIKFWRTQCTFCRQSMPKLSSKTNEISDDDFVILTISVDVWDGIQSDKVLEYLEDHAMEKWLNVYDGGSINSSINHQYGVRGTPQAYLIDRNGVVASQIDSRSSQFVTTIKEELVR